MKWKYTCGQRKTYLGPSVADHLKSVKTGCDPCGQSRTVLARIHSHCSEMMTSFAGSVGRLQTAHINGWKRPPPSPREAGELSTTTAPRSTNNKSLFWFPKPPELVQRFYFTMQYHIFSFSPLELVQKLQLITMVTWCCACVMKSEVTICTWSSTTCWPHRN
jgi:hypothetical protein